MMKHRLFICVLLLPIIAWFPDARCQVSIVKDVTGCGGGRAAGATWTIEHTVGQGAIGLVSGDDHLHGIGFWYMPWSYVTGIGDEDDTPRAYRLYQNVPNPFNPFTRIRFDTPRPSRVVVRVYDVSGRLVLTAHDGVLAAGRHEIPVDAGNLATGVYFYRVIAGGFKATRKMVVLR